jgi:hypothetical protein
METPDQERLMTVFKRLTLTTGRAVYDWSPKDGLYRLGIEHIFIPRTRAPFDVLSYILSSRHYGVYLLRDFDEALGKPTVERHLTKLVEKDDGVRRLVFLMGQQVPAPASLWPHIARIRHSIREQRLTGTG